MSDKDKMTGGKPDEPVDTATFPVGGGVVSPEDPAADEPMTEAQAAELRDLCEKVDEPFDASMTREQADARIDVLKKK